MIMGCPGEENTSAHKESQHATSVFCAKFQWLFTWRVNLFEPLLTVFVCCAFPVLLQYSSIIPCILFAHHPPLCSRPNPLIPTSSLADTLTTNPLNPAESWRKSQHLQPCCLQLCLLSHRCHRNLQTKHGCESLQPCRLTLSLWLLSILPALSCPSSSVLNIIWKVWHWVFKTTCFAASSNFSPSPFFVPVFTFHRPSYFSLHPRSQCHLQTLGFVKAALSKYCLIWLWAMTSLYTKCFSSSLSLKLLCHC